MRSTKLPSWIEAPAGLRAGAGAAARLRAGRRGGCATASSSAPAAASACRALRSVELPRRRLPQRACSAGRCAIRPASGSGSAGCCVTSPAACARPRWCCPTPGCGWPSPRAASCRKRARGARRGAALEAQAPGALPRRGAAGGRRRGAAAAPARRSRGGCCSASRVEQLLAQLEEAFAAPRGTPRAGHQRQPGAWPAPWWPSRASLRPPWRWSTRRATRWSSCAAASRSSTATRRSPTRCRRRRGRAWWSRDLQADPQLPRRAASPDRPSAAVLLVAPPELEPLWLDLLAEGLGEPAAALDGRHLPPLRPRASLLAWRELAPLLGAARQEVA